MDVPAITPTVPTVPAVAPAPEANPPQVVERKLQEISGGTAVAAPGPRGTHTHTETRFDENLNRVVGRIVNEQTGETIQEFPPEQLKALYTKMREQLGHLYQGALIVTHRDGFPRLSARSAWRGDAGHRKPCATPPESLGKPPFRSGRRTAGGRRKALTMPRIARGFPPTRPLARRIACPISMGHYQRSLVLVDGTA